MSDTNLKNLEYRANKELELLGRWFRANKMVLNAKKTKFILFGVPNSSKELSFRLELEGDILGRVSENDREKFVKLVGVALDENLSFKHHVNLVKAKLNRANFILARSGRFLTKEVRLIVYNSLVKSVLDFSSWVYGNSGKTQIDQLFKLQKKIVRNVQGVGRRVHTNQLFTGLEILKVPDLIEYNTRIIGWKIWNETAPKNLCEGYEKRISNRTTRSTADRILTVPFCKRKRMEVAPCFAVPKIWNEICNEVKKIDKLRLFKAKLISDYLDSYRQEPPCKLKNCFACSLAFV